MYQSDYILRLIEDMAQFWRKAIQYVQNGEIEEIVTEDGMVNGIAFFEYRLTKLFYEGRYCEAEDLLFEQLEKKDGKAYIPSALQFYQRLSEVDGNKLLESGYSEERIRSGLKRVREMFPIDADAYDE